jgi:urease accessory protein UreF
MLYLFFVWCALAAFVLSLAMYRKLVARSEDDLVHLGEADERLVNQQKTVASRLETIDRWERVLTTFTIAFGLVIGAIYLYRGWMDSSQLQP